VQRAWIWVLGVAIASSVGGLLALKTSCHTFTVPDAPADRVCSQPHVALAIGMLAAAVFVGSLAARRLSADR
jgi:hypothetical protein